MADLTMGQRIAEERKRLGISQEVLGDKVGVSRQAISKWESDGAVPEIDKLIVLSKLFGVSVGWLLGVEKTEIAEESAPQEPEAPAVREPTLLQAFLAYLKTLPGLRKLGILLLVLVQLFLYWQLIWCYNTAKRAEAYTSMAEQATDRLEMELEALKAAMGDPEVPEPGTLLSAYTFETIQPEARTNATVTFAAVPYSWQEGDTGTLYIQGQGIPTMQIPCQWDGAFLNCFTKLELRSGIELCFSLEHADGSRQFQALYDDYLQNTEFSAPPLIIGSVDSAEYDPEKNVFLVRQLEVNFSRLASYEETGTTWQTMAVLLLADGEEVARHTIFDANIQRDSTLTTGGGGIEATRKELPLMENAVLTQGQQIELVAYADFSNGICAQETIGRWTVGADGALTPVVN